MMSEYASAIAVNLSNNDQRIALLQQTGHPDSTFDVPQIKNHMMSEELQKKKKRKT
jgi:hypothetical protein